MKISDQAIGYGILIAAIAFPFAAAIFEFDPGKVLLKIVTAFPVLMILSLILFAAIVLIRWLFRIR